jgi:microcystin-dependent protein
MNVPDSPQFIQAQEINENAPMSESMLQKIAGSLNYILNQIEQYAVGEIVSCNLTEAQFQAVMGTGWILCDGRDVTGSAFAQLFSSTVLPDLRGMFLRGKQNNRADIFGNASGDLPLGTFQTDQLASHSHATTQTGQNLASFSSTNQCGTGSTYADITGPSNMSATIQNAGGNETRVLNSTTNFFIRVN